MKESPTSDELSGEKASDQEEGEEDVFNEFEEGEDEEGGESELDYMKKDNENIFDKNDSDVDAYMDQLEDDELAQDGLKIPGDVESDEYGGEEEEEDY